MFTGVETDQDGTFWVNTYGIRDDAIVAEKIIA
jgi:hypothetical protein